MQNSSLYSVALSFLWFAGSFAFAQSESEQSDWATARTLYPGILLLQIRTETPRPMFIHAVRVDLSTPKLALHTTPPAKCWEENHTETIRESTRDYLRHCRLGGLEMVLAVNADSFEPWPAPYQQKSPTNVGGLAISGGVIVSPPTGTPSLVVDKSGSASIRTIAHEDVLDDIQLAVSGFSLCLKDGAVQPSGPDLHPRTGLGLSADNQWLYIVVVDGRRYSRQGATTQELGEWLKRFGAHNGINMDGGGSSTLAWWNPSAEIDEAQPCELINAPVGNGTKYETAEKDAVYRPSERANGNHLGVYYKLAP